MKNKWGYSTLGLAIISLSPRPKIIKTKPKPNNNHQASKVTKQKQKEIKPFVEKAKCLIPEQE